jgi:Domain of unknown function (DUF4340)
MNSKNTLSWFVVAVALFAFICVYQFFRRPVAPASVDLLPGLRPSAVTSIQVFPNDSPEISVERTNGGWVMTQPVVYPGQKAAIESLLNALKKLTVATRVASGGNTDSEYGFKTPETITLQSGDDRWEILVGNKTAPEDEVFLRVVGSDGIFVTDAGWLNFIPRSAADWRDTALVGSQGDYDSLILTNGAKIIELHANPTNHLWQMTYPLTARANGDYIAKAMQQLQAARVSQFITDNPNADPTVYGLQPADLDLWLGNGSNYVDAVHVGKTATNDPTQTFARRGRWKAVVTTPKEPLSPWYGTVNDFRDPYLVELTAPVAEIEMIGPGTNHFKLQQADSNTWKIPGENFPVDTNSVQRVIQILASLRVSQFVKDVVTPADLAANGLTNAWRQIILRSAVGNSNAVIAHLLFGNVDTNQVIIQRADENFIYAITPEDYKKLPESQAWLFRDRTIWDFAETNVAQVTVRQNGKTWQLIHHGPNHWSLGAGSGFITPAGVEETIHDLGHLYAYYTWVARGISKPADYGFKPGNLSITVTLKDGRSYTVDFGLISRDTNTAVAAVTLDDERWAFIFPPDMFQLVSSYLIPQSSVP